MIFAEFYHNSTGWNGVDFSGPVKLIPACGNSSVIILDGRLKLDNLKTKARETCVKRGYKGFILCKGENFARNKPITSLEVIGA